ncbi:S1 family peptidase [Streptosporangium sp. NBC_01639]|uniref:S1 family peptidase n=1 Tax=Streptosporangium sp. NBC_01639 TaxID=2975948 RepID=UPI003865E015|nr:S1 family peptidase [Streptosporangium sp. NBC_01639]
MPRRHAAVTWRVLATIALALAVAPAVAPFPAAGAAAVWDPPPELVEALQRDLHLTREQALARLRNEARLTAVEAELRKKIGDRFGGSWFVGTVAQTLVVATTSPADLPRITAAGARPLLVKRSLKQLNAVRARVDAVLSNHPNIASVRYVDAQGNVVVVLSSRVAAIVNILKAAGVDMAVVRVIFSNELPQPVAAPMSGDACHAGTASSCPVGFSALKGSGTASSPPATAVGR